jgi:hypothetical protein
LAILLLGVFASEMKSVCQRDICAPKFIAVIFTIAKRQKYLKCPLADD